MTSNDEKKGCSNDCKSKTTLWDVTDRLLTDWKRMIWFAVLLSIISVIASLTLWAALKVVRSSQLQITQLASGGILYRVGNEETLSFLLSASQGWARTDYLVREGEELEFRASGRVCLAVHHLVEGAKKDKRPVHGWVGPKGIGTGVNPSLRKQDIWRSKFLLVPGQSYGALVAGISTTDGPPSGNDPIFYVGDNLEHKKATATGKLWFAVNDVLLNPNMRQAYEVPGGERSGGYKPPRTFDEIVADQYWNLWYDDNVGTFMITVRREP